VSGAVSEGFVSYSNLFRLGCPSNLSIVDVTFASYGTPLGHCPAAAPYYLQAPIHDSVYKSHSVDDELRLGECHHPRSVEVVLQLCLGRTACTIFPSDRRFGGGDPCPGVPKAFAARVLCGDDKDRIAAMHDFIFRTRHPFAAATSSSVDGGRWGGAAASLFTGNLTFTQLAMDLERGAPVRCTHAAARMAPRTRLHAHALRSAQTLQPIVSS
jgi:hypothetical protein